MTHSSAARLGSRVSAPILEHRALGVRSYDEVWALQQALRDRLLEGGGDDVLLSVEHRPGVLTAGRRARQDELCISQHALEQQGIQIRAVERGGSWTWHGPGQLVAYPVVALARWALKVPEFVAGIEWAMAQVLEGVLVEAGVDLAAVGLRVGQLKGFPGTWVQRSNGSCAKVGAVGVHVRRFVSIHGLALNLDPEPWGFKWIIPCGLEGVETTSAARLIGEFDGDLATLPTVAIAADRLAALLPGCWSDGAGRDAAQGAVCLKDSSLLTR